MNFILHYFLILGLCLPRISSSFSAEHVLCNRWISTPNLDLSSAANQNISIKICDLTFNVTLESNNSFLSSNMTHDESMANVGNTHFIYNGRLRNDNQSSISVIIYPQLQIYLYVNGTYYYYLTSSTNSVITLKLSQQQLIQLYPQLVNDSLWKILRHEEDHYQKTSPVLHDLHFAFDLLTLRCPSNTVSLCTLALLIDRTLYENSFHSDIHHVYAYVEHFNFILRSLTNHRYGGFTIKTVKLIDFDAVHANESLDLLHQLSTNATIESSDYCLVHQMLLTKTDGENQVLGYPSSVQTYDIGGICSPPFTLTNNNNHTEEYNLNTGLSVFNENITKNLSLIFNGLMKTSYLFLRQMGLNLTLCSMNTTRKGFFHFNSEMSLSVPYCVNLVSSTLRQALERRAHLCFNRVNCQRSIDGGPSTLNDGPHHRRSEWLEGNIVGIILTLSLLLWIPVSCFVHFCVDEINKRSLIEKQQEMETVPMKSSVNEPAGIAKQTQTD